jgi:hypothetical protein
MTIGNRTAACARSVCAYRGSNDNGHSDNNGHLEDGGATSSRVL